jgi:hypothetical protein
MAFESARLGLPVPLAVPLRSVAGLAISGMARVPWVSGPG